MFWVGISIPDDTKTLIKFNSWLTLYTSCWAIPELLMNIQAKFLKIYSNLCNFTEEQKYLRAHVLPKPWNTESDKCLKRIFIYYISSAKYVRLVKSGWDKIIRSWPDAEQNLLRTAENKDSIYSTRLSKCKQIGHEIWYFGFQNC